MASKENCWEFTNCGRQPDGDKAHEHGECVAATDARADGVHGGKNAGRACWAIAGTLCGGSVQGSFASKLGTCLRCDFYQHLMRSEPSLKSHSELHALFE